MSLSNNDSNISDVKKNKHITFSSVLKNHCMNFSRDDNDANVKQNALYDNVTFVHEKNFNINIKSKSIKTKFIIFILFITLDNVTSNNKTISC